jgi:hypothetical protein
MARVLYILIWVAFTVIWSVDPTCAELADARTTLISVDESQTAGPHTPVVPPQSSLAGGRYY